jgi:hypothetical protein
LDGLSEWQRLGESASHPDEYRYDFSILPIAADLEIGWRKEILRVAAG